MVLTDFFRSIDHAIEQELLVGPFTWSGESDAEMVNDVGVSAGCEMLVIDVEPGKAYRWKFLGDTALRMRQSAVIGHRDAQIILSADARYTKPYPVDSVQVKTGQRY